MYKDLLHPIAKNHQSTAKKLIQR